jgi:hypothetical protein
MYGRFRNNLFSLSSITYVSVTIDFFIIMLYISTF